MKNKTVPSPPKVRKARKKISGNAIHTTLNWVFGIAAVVLTYFAAPSGWVEVGDGDIASVELPSPVNGWILFALYAGVVISVTIRHVRAESKSWGFVDANDAIMGILFGCIAALIWLIAIFAGSVLLTQNHEIKDVVSNSIVIDADDTPEEIVEELKEEKRATLNGEETRVYNEKNDRSGKYSKYYEYAGTVDEVLKKMSRYNL